MKIKKYILTIIKYLLSCMILIMAFASFPSKKYLLIWGGEIIIIAALTNLIMVEKKSSKYAALRRFLGRLFNDIALLLMLSQVVIMRFSTTYISLVMITNLDNIQDQSGNKIYGFAIILTLVTILIPVEHFTIPWGDEETAAFRTRLLCYQLTLFFLMINIVFFFKFTPDLSTFNGYFDLITQWKYQRTRNAQLASSENVTADYYRSYLDDAIERPESLDENPNIIIILTEGLSSSIIDDTERNIMPNMKALEESGVYFDNYYNHTFATYRGIIGQLYSGYQNDNYDSNSLISIMDILEDRDYHTIFINTEPENLQFDDYLDVMGFDDVISADTSETGIIACVSDKDAYELLYQTVEEESGKDQPYLIVMYTFCTHNSFDSSDEYYGDGNVAVYNKFYNADYQFGSFFDKWSVSDMSDNSLLVMTTDHATYSDGEYAAAFPESYAARPTANVDEIPLILWHKGVTPAVYDAEGRNSLDMAPTVLDYIDVDAENYFLGTTLFSRFGTDYDIIFHTDGFLLSTNMGKLEGLSDIKADYYWDMLYKYFAAKQQEPQKPE